ncbi:3-oxoacyl-[acyl-carrier-protein] reductase [Lachnellula occidentalis]|uniref:3-oxoacyl-[acyl-carrier-protein] reductase n=1 Tax=Lachnellula occidentalis TaxID=215460 RepID=A0A8H8RHR7_9HELO|nr:3-oxoacyl-[acyl-carrier-protein] reductase [Lachnellula occidentalis]
MVNNINYRGCWLSSRAELAQMVRQEPLPSHDGRPGERGSVVNIASQLGVVGRPNAPVEQLWGKVDTPMTQREPEFRKALEPAIAIAPMKRMGTAQEIADACLFLCSGKASFVQGHALVS